MWLPGLGNKLFMETWADHHSLGGKSVCLSPDGGGGHGLEQCHRNELPVQVWRTILDAWGWCTGTTQRDGIGREEGSGWGTCVCLWRIHFNIWQNKYNIVKFKKKQNYIKKKEQYHRVIDTSFREDCQASESESVSHSVVSNSLQPHRL